MINSTRLFTFTKLIKTPLCLVASHRFSSSIEPVTSPPETLPEKFDPSEEFLSFTSPSFNFAAYVNKSETLKKFVALGVDLSKIEKKKGLPQFVLKLDFDRDIKKHLFFLHDLGLPAECYGEFITKNPLIFKESIEDLETRIYYLRSKKFTVEQVRRIVEKNPFWLSFSTRRIDRRLGWFQKNFKLGGDDIRFLAVKQPQLITYNMDHIREATFSIREQMGFDEDEMKVLLLSKPRYWMNDHSKLIERFDFIHNIMKISHDKILQSPEILSLRLHRLKQRYEFLKMQGKVQFDESKPGYIPLKSFVEGTDPEFVINICKSTPETFDNFLKTL